MARGSSSHRTSFMEGKHKFIPSSEKAIASVGLFWRLGYVSLCNEERKQAYFQPLRRKQNTTCTIFSVTLHFEQTHIVYSVVGGASFLSALVPMEMHNFWQYVFALPDPSCLSLPACRDTLVGM